MKSLSDNPNPNALKDTYDHSCFLAYSNEYQHLMTLTSTPTGGADAQRADWLRLPRERPAVHAALAQGDRGLLDGAFGYLHSCAYFDLQCPLFLSVPADSWLPCVSCSTGPTAWPAPVRAAAVGIHRGRAERAGQRRVRSHCHFITRGTEYISKSGMNWMIGSTKRQCGRALGQRELAAWGRQPGDRWLLRRARLAQGLAHARRPLHLDRHPANPSEKDTKLAQKLIQLQPFIAVFQQECMGQLASFGPT